MGKRVFKSKVDAWLIIVMVASTLLVAGACFSIDNSELLAYIINIVLVAVMVFVFFAIFNIRYEVSEDTLFVRSFILLSYTIPVADIREIRASSSWLASPAASLDRLEIRYGKRRTILLSPVDKQGFVDCLIGVNPNIVCKNG